MRYHYQGGLIGTWWRELRGITNSPQNRKERGKRRTIVIVAEGAQDRHLNKISSSKIKDILTERLNLDTRVTVLGHTQRGGAACAYDRWLSTLQGVEAVRAVLDMKPEAPSPVITIRENKILRMPLMDAVQHTKTVTKHIQNKEFAEAMALRDSEFKEYHFSYINTSTPDHPKLLLPENKVCRHSSCFGAELTKGRECALVLFTLAPPLVV